MAHKTTLSAFIRENTADIVSEWSSFAKTRTPASETMSALALRDHIVEILTFIADDVESYQTKREQIDKSHGEGPKDGGLYRSAAEIHAALRLEDGFDIDQMVSEYRALRASVVKLWRTKNSNLDDSDLDDLTRFNEAVDQTMTESITHYTKAIEHSRNIFLGILGHDLRNPLGAATQLAELLMAKTNLDEKQTVLTTQIVTSTKRANLIVSDLLDLTRAAFGSEIPVVKSAMDMGAMAAQMIDEMKAFYPACDVHLTISGDMKGEWDRARMGQIFSNLIGNAIQHGAANTPVEIGITGGADKIEICVRNQGIPIPPDKQERIFESLVQGDSGDSGDTMSAHLGLGLYITKKIAMAHGGSIAVTSSTADGTAFTVSLPRH